MPLSREALEDAQALIREQLEACIDPAPACRPVSHRHPRLLGQAAGRWGQDGGHSLLVALGIELAGAKQVLGFWLLKGRESKAA